MTGNNTSQIKGSAFRSYMDSLCVSAFSDPSFRSIQNASQRRHLSRTQAAWSILLSLTMYLMTSGLTESWLQRNLGLGATIAAVICLASLVISVGFWVLSTGLLNASVGGATELADRHLDEAQRSLRDSAYRKAYRFIAAGGFVLWLVLLVVGFPAGAAIIPLSLLLFIILACAPVHIMAWTMPDTDFEDDNGAMGETDRSA